MDPNEQITLPEENIKEQTWRYFLVKTVTIFYLYLTKLSTIVLVPLAPIIILHLYHYLRIGGVFILKDFPIPKSYSILLAICWAFAAAAVINGVNSIIQRGDTRIIESWITAGIKTPLMIIITFLIVYCIAGIILIIIFGLASLILMPLVQSMSFFGYVFLGLLILGNNMAISSALITIPLVVFDKKWLGEPVRVLFAIDKRLLLRYVTVVSILFLPGYLLSVLIYFYPMGILIRMAVYVAGQLLFFLPLICSVLIYYDLFSRYDGNIPIGRSLTTAGKGGDVMLPPLPSS